MIQKVDRYGRIIDINYDDKRALLASIDALATTLNKFGFSTTSARKVCPPHTVCNSLNEFGWKEDQIPDFKNLSNDTATVTPTDKPPRADSKMWEILDAMTELALGKDALDQLKTKNANVLKTVANKLNRAGAYDIKPEHLSMIFRARQTTRNNK